MAELSVRPLDERDVEPIVKYWSGLSPEDVVRMGVDVVRLPGPEAMRQIVRETLAVPPGQGASGCMIWEVDGVAIGFSTLKNIVPRVSGGMHLHIWDRERRGRGHGAALFCLSALEFYRLFAVASIVCEPSATNPLPNRMLQKVGFPLVRTYFGRSSALSAETLLNCYDIRRDVAERFLVARRRWRRPRLFGALMWE